MRLHFQDVTLKDREWVDPLLQLSARDSLEYSFTTAFVWRHIYGYQIARMDDYFLLRERLKHPAYLFPAGRGPLDPVLRALESDARQLGFPLALNAVPPDAKATLEQTYPGKFTFALDRDGADYVYETQALATLQGKKLASKRNHINRFLDAHPDWQYEPLSPKNLDDVRRMNTIWCMKVGCNYETEISSSQETEIGDEYCAVETAIRHYDELNLSGGLIRAEGRVIAFSIGDPLNENTFLVHFEKAFAEVQGAYQMINQQFVRHSCMAYPFVDREEDTGIAGLRRAKLSYHPVRLVEKYTAVLKEPL